MKVIQSYIPFGSEFDPNPTLTKEYTYLALLSSLQLKKLYGEVTLYTNKPMAEFFKQMDFPYTYDTSLDGHKAAYFAMPKMRAFMAQTEPFVHYDLDTLVFDKPRLEDMKSPFIFSHRDMPNDGYYKKDRRVPKVKSKAVNHLIQDRWFNNLMESYLLAYYRCEELPEGYPSFRIDPETIPNMNIIGIKDVKTFQKATKVAMKIADDNKHIFEGNWLASNFIEQLTIPIYLQEYSKKYIKALEAHKEKDPIGSPFMFGGDPFTCLGFPTDDPIWQKELPKYPFKLQHFYRCNECLDWHKAQYELKSDKDLLKYGDLSQFRYCHIGGGNKQYAMWQFMIINTLVTNFGEDMVLKVTDYFRLDDLKRRNKKYKLSPGEELYEKITGNTLFSKKFKDSQKNTMI